MRHGNQSGWALALLLLFVPCSSFAGPVLTHEATLTLPRVEGAGPLPVSVSVAPDGGICVTDAENMAAVLLNSQDIQVFSSDPAAALISPSDISVDADGGFVCTDVGPNGQRTIRRLNFFGEPTAYEPERPDSIWEPEHLLITRDGNFVTLDSGHALLAKHDASSGALLWKRVLEQSADKEMLGAGRPVESPDGHILLPLGAGRRVAVLSSEGEQESAFGTPGTGAGRFAFPVGAAFCPDGTIAVLDRMRGTVLLFDSQYSFVAEFGEFGAGPDKLYQPTAIAAGADGRVYVVQGYGSRIHVFRFSNQGSSWIPTDQARPDQAGTAGADRPSPEGGGCPGDPRASLAPCRSHSSHTQPEIHADLHNGGC